jgi:long-chain acyl-CoA synthetase
MSRPYRSPKSEEAPAHKTIQGTIEEVALERPRKVALEMRSGNEHVVIRYGELVERFRQWETRLTAVGLRPGDRVAIFAENRPEWFVGFLAVLAAGGTAVPLDAALDDAGLEELLRASDVTAILTSRTLTERVLASPAAEFAFVFDLTDELKNVRGPLRRVDHGNDGDPTIAAMLFTSGTTGPMRGVLLEHQSLIHAAHDTAAAASADATDELLAVLPFHHVYPLVASLVAPLFTGIGVTVVPTVTSEAMLSAMAEKHPSILIAVPRLLELFLAGIRRKARERGRLAGGLLEALLGANAFFRRRLGVNLGKLLFGRVHRTFGGAMRIIASGGAPLDASTQRGIRGLGFTVCEGYGLTETCGPAIANRFESIHPDTVGKGITGVEARIAHPNAAGVGEICVRGPIVMRGYFREPAASRRAIRNGWFRTGDLGAVDHEGNFRIVGRIKEVIVTSGGKKSVPTEIEERYRGLPGVAELAVVGVPVPGSLGERVHAAVVPVPGATEAEILAEVMSRSRSVPTHQQIQKVHVISEIPKTRMLKPKRDKLRNLFMSREASQLAGAQPAPARGHAATDELSRKILAIVQRAQPDGRTVSPGDSLQFDLDVDSLGRLELIAAVERELGIRIPRRLSEIQSVADLIQLASQAPKGEPVAPSAGPVPSPTGWFARAILRAFGLFTKIFWRVEVSGLENVPRKGPVIFCANHESHLDVFWVTASLPGSLASQVCCFAKQEHFENVFTRAVARLVGAIPVDRDGDIQPALETGVRALREKRSLVIHPEGTRTKTGVMGPFRAGAAFLAIAQGAPVVPVRLTGAYGIFPSHHWFPRPWGNLRIRFGAPLVPPPPGKGALIESTFTERIRAAVAALEEK